MRSVAIPHERVQIFFPEPTMTKQSFQDECDVRTIMRRFEKGEAVTHLNTHQGDYGDYIGVEDYHASMNRIHEANALFMTIPPTIRAKFNNSPAEFLEFAQNPDNHDDLVELGLATGRLKASPDAAIIPPAPPLPETPPEAPAPASGA